MPGQLRLWQCCLSCGGSAGCGLVSSIPRHPVRLAMSANTPASQTNLFLLLHANNQQHCTAAASWLSQAERLAHLMLSPQPLAAAVLIGAAEHPRQPPSPASSTPGSASDPDPANKRPRLCQDASDEKNTQQDSHPDECDASARVLAARLREALSPGMQRACQSMAQVNARRRSHLLRARDAVGTCGCICGFAHDILVWSQLAAEFTPVCLACAGTDWHGWVARGVDTFDVESETGK